MVLSDHVVQKLGTGWRRSLERFEDASWRSNLRLLQLIMMRDSSRRLEDQYDGNKSDCKNQD